MSSSSLQTTFEGMLGIQPKKTGKLPSSTCMNYEELKTVNTTGMRKSDARSSWNRVCLLSVFIASMLVNISILGYLAFIQLPETFANHNTEAFPASDLSDSICLSCESLNIANPESIVLATEVKVINVEHKTLCCLKHSEHIRTMLNLVAGEYVHARNPNASRVATILKSSHASAHLYLNTTSETDALMQWESDAGYGTAHVTGGVVYNNGSLRVREDGFYFLYSHLTLYVSPDTHTKGRDVLHCVQRYNRKFKETGNQLLLMSKMSVNARDRKTTFLAASLRLRRNDEVFVQFSDPSLVYKFSPANFFGLYLL